MNQPKTSFFPSPCAVRCAAVGQISGVRSTFKISQLRQVPRFAKILNCHRLQADPAFFAFVVNLLPFGEVFPLSGRYYSVQFTDPSNNTNFAYVGKPATGTEAGDFLVSGPGWKGTMPQGTTQISSPNNSVLVIGRVFVESESDLSTAYDLAKQIRLTPQGN